jgi:hypothetical protein
MVSANDDREARSEDSPFWPITLVLAEIAARVERRRAEEQLAPLTDPAGVKDSVMTEAA